MARRSSASFERLIAAPLAMWTAMHSLHANNLATEVTANALEELTTRLLYVGSKFGLERFAQTLRTLPGLSMLFGSSVVFRVFIKAISCVLRETDK